MPDLTSFAMLGLPARFRLSEEEIQRGWKRAVSAVHPDRFADRPIAERRAAEQWTGRINAARETLASPSRRALELLRLRGHPADPQASVRLDPDFLMLQLRWREAAETAGGALPAALRPEVERAREEESERLAAALDDAFDPEGARRSVARLMFIEKTLSLGTERAAGDGS